MNITILKGNLTRDPEINTLPSGDSVVNFSIAVNDYYNDKQTGQQKQITDYFDCKAYGSKADNINKFFNKGRPILIEGALKQEKWTDNNGQNRSKVIVRIKDWQFVDSKNNDNNTGSTVKKQYDLEESDIAGDELEIDGLTV